MPIRAAVLPGPLQPPELRSLPDPALEPGGALLETLASEVCGTDVHLFHGRLAGVPYPIVPGHVTVGRLLETRGVEADALGRPLHRGDRVTFYDVHEVCNACWHCLVARQPNRCPSRKVYGITYGAAEGPLGGWAERVYLKPGVRILKLPDELSVEAVMGGGCGLFTGFAAVERSGLAMGDTVVVQGAGPVGLSAAAFAALRGAGLVVLVGDPPDRLAHGLRLGADLSLSLAEPPQDRASRVWELTGGRGADAVIEATGNPAAVAEGLSLVRDGGVYVVAGHYTDTGEVSLNPHTDLNRKHVEVRGQWGTDFHHVVRALRMLAKHHDRLPFATLVGNRYSLEDAARALADVEAQRVTKALIVP